MSEPSPDSIVLPLMFGCGQDVDVHCYSSRVSVTLREPVREAPRRTHSNDADADSEFTLTSELVAVNGGWGRRWSPSDDVNLETSRSNQVREIQVRTEMVDGDVSSPAATEAMQDIVVGLRWGIGVRGRRCVGEESTTFALDFGDVEADVWQRLGEGELWIGSTTDGYLAGLIGTTPTVPTRSVDVEFSSTSKFEASLHDAQGLTVYATSARAQAEEVALNEAWLDGGDQAPHDCWIERDAETTPSQRLESADGAANLTLDADGSFSYLDVTSRIVQGHVKAPDSTLDAESVSVTSTWPASIELVSDPSERDHPRAEVRFNGLAPTRWHTLGDDGPWIGVGEGNELARIIVSVNPSQGFDEDDDSMDHHSIDGMSRMMAKHEARQDEALERLDFPVYGMAGEWERERTASIEADDEPIPGVSAVELEYGTQHDLTLPYLEVRTSNEPWRRMELRRGTGTEFAHEFTGWLSHLTRLPVEGHETRAEAAGWFAEGHRQEQELAQRPWHECSISVDGELLPFKMLAHEHGWVARGLVGELVVDLKALYFPIEDVALVAVDDLGPFIAGRKKQIADIEEQQQEWQAKEGAPDWAIEAKKGAARATRRLLGGLMDGDLSKVVDVMSDEVVKPYGGRDGYRSMLSIFMGARGFCGFGTNSHAWVNGDGTLVGTVVSLSLVPEEPSDNGMMMTSSSVAQGADDPNWWGLSDPQVRDAVLTAEGDTESLDDELPLVVLCERDGDEFRVVSDLVEQLAAKLGAPAELVQPK